MGIEVVSAQASTALALQEPVVPESLKSAYDACIFENTGYARTAWPPPIPNITIVGTLVAVYRACQEVKIATCLTTQANAQHDQLRAQAKEYCEAKNNAQKSTDAPAASRETVRACQIRITDPRNW